ncbi:hypothetical protein EGW08_006347 [Elysia chlorotica]|uniref:Glycoside hydrolase family 5 domain-containing protein n=1 Tax=Elysia chlorotica TaxID=188477 RepID=A0A433TWB3_ELYCH|nr:hypothetical protein EGW08_006347 [Elysia chlorotica]
MSLFRGVVLLLLAVTCTGWIDIESNESSHSALVVRLEDLWQAKPAATAHTVPQWEIEKPANFQYAADELDAKPANFQYAADELDAKPANFQYAADELDAKPANFQYAADELDAKPANFRYAADELDAKPANFQYPAEDQRNAKPAAYPNFPRRFDVKVDVSKSLHITDPRYLSVTIDTQQFSKDLPGFDFSSRKFRILAAALSPTHVRIGGTYSDFLHFDPDGVNGAALKNSDLEHKVNTLLYPEYAYSKRLKYLTMTANAAVDYLYIDIFGAAANAAVNYLYIDIFGAAEDAVVVDHVYIDIFGAAEDAVVQNFIFILLPSMVLFQANCGTTSDPGTGTSSGQWDPTEAEEFLKYSAERGVRMPSFQLGNEPNSFRYNFNFTVEPAVLVEGFRRLRDLISVYPQYDTSSIFGPESTNLDRHFSSRTYLIESVHVLKLFSWLHHHNATLPSYYLLGESATLDQFLDPRVMDELRLQMDYAHNITREHCRVPKPIRFTETSSSTGGGTKGLSDRYVAGFL